MKANTKKAMDCSLRAAMLAAETDLSREVIEARVSPRRVIFAPLEPVIDSL
jgi:hypothetical protein